MMRATKDALSGTPDKVSARLEELSRNLAQHDYAAGTRLRMLAVELTKRPNLRVSLVTYNDESPNVGGSQELEVVCPDDPHCEPMLIDTVARALSSWPSLALNVKLSEPLKPIAGV